MTGKERAVIEAARELVAGYNLDGYPGLQDFVESVQALDAEQGDDYKWLAMHSNGKTNLLSEKPIWEKRRWADRYDKDRFKPLPRKYVDSPSFLKTGQLWERDEKSNEVEKINPSYQEWNGYWWRLVEDHGKDEREEISCLNNICMSTLNDDD